MRHSRSHLKPCFSCHAGVAKQRRRQLWCFKMRNPEALCHHVSQVLVEALCTKGTVCLSGQRAAVANKLASALLANFSQEAALEKEAERLAEAHIQKSPTVDRHKVVQLIKRRLAEERDFAL